MGDPGDQQRCAELADFFRSLEPRPTTRAELLDHIDRIAGRALFMGQEAEPSDDMDAMVRCAGAIAVLSGLALEADE